MLRHVLDDHTQLRLLRPEDAGELFALIDANRTHLRPWFEMVDATREASDTAGWISQMLAGRAENPARGWFGIFHHDRLVGCAGVAESDPKKGTAQIGYYLAADACGKGLATAPAGLLLTICSTTCTCIALVYRWRLPIEQASGWLNGSISS